MQEAALAQHTPSSSSPAGRYRTLNALPLKYRLFDKVINAPHPVDPADLRPAAQDTPAAAA